MKTARENLEGYSIPAKQILKDLHQATEGRGDQSLGMLNPKTETDPTQPTLNKVTQEQFAKLIDKQVQCDLDYLDALAQSRGGQGNPRPERGQNRR